MTTSSRYPKGVEAKQEGDANDGKFSKEAASTSRQWSAFRNPRIVRVSRNFGGKDRHSKVCTIRGLRDRRIRLSVPTAIQLYDLQERLGLSQPSKVIDWLLDATKDDVDKLPPLQLPQGFEQFHQQMLASHEFNPSLHSSIAPLTDANSMLIKDVHGGIHSLGVRINSGLDLEDQNAKANSKYWDAAEASLSAKSKEVESLAEKGKWVKANIEQGNQVGLCNYSGDTGQLSTQKFFPMASHSSLPSYSLPNNSIPINSYYHLDASNLSLSQFGSHGFLSQQTESPLNNNAVSLPMPSSLALSSGSHLFFCPPPTMSSLFPPLSDPYGNASAVDPRETNHFQLLGSSSSQQTPPSSRAMSSSTKPVSLSVNPGLVHFGRNEESHRGKDNNTNS